MDIDILTLLQPSQLILLLFMFYQNSKMEKEMIRLKTEIINLKDINVKYVGRKASSSTATGNANKHLAQQKEILEKILKD